MRPASPGAAIRDPASAPLVSLIVVTYNSAGLLPAFFEALWSTTYPNYELLVVDNASRDRTLAYLARDQPRATVISSHANLGYGRACNLGAEQARGEFLVFLNPDVVVTPEWLALLVEHLVEQPDVAVICPTTLYPGESPPRPRVTVEEVAAVPGCAIMVPRAAWEALGGFDEQIFLYWEDTELCWRAWLLGWRVLADLEATVFHERGGSTGGRGWDAESAKNSLYTYLKLMRWRRVAPFATSLAARTLAKLLLGRAGGVRGWVWNVANLRRTLALRRALRRQRRGDPAALEQRLAAHTRRMRRERRLTQARVP